MAKTGVFEVSDPAARAARAARVTELKKELQRLVRIIGGDEECSVEVIDQAREALHALREMRARRRSSLSLACPEEYRCPISKELMRDPVIVATGQTYDRPSIQKWLKAGNRTCPQTQQVLSHAILTPNNLIRELILRWCKSRGFELSEPVHCIDEDSITESERDRFLNLLEKMSSNISEQKEAAKELRSLTKRMPSFRALFGESADAITQLLSPLSERESPSGTHLDLQEDVITTLLNLSIHDNNKKLVAEIPSVIPLLIDALRSGTIQTRSNAAAALFTLSALDSNKILIGKSGALKFLIDLLDEGHTLAMTDVASAIFNLCISHENRDRAVQDGAVGVILDKIANRIHVDELLAILAMLSSHQRAIEEMCELAAVPCLLRVMRETSCARIKENCIAILHTICVNDRTKLKELREEEHSHGTVSDLAKNGTSRAQRKANWILGKLNRAINFTHTA